MGSGNEIIKGIMPAIISPCDDKDRFMEDEFAAMAASLYKDGVHGLYVCGGTGDAYSMRLPERKRAAEIASGIGRAHNAVTIVHVGTVSTRDAAELAEHAAAVGATAISSMPPANTSHAQVKSYYTDIAKAAQIPVLIYHIPALTRHSPSVGEMSELLAVPGVVGLKFSDANLFFLQQLLMNKPETIAFNGNDELLCPGLLYGSAGGIGMTYNVFPKLFVQLYRLIGEGDIAGAMALQNKLNRFVDLLVRRGPKPVFELALERRGLPSRCFRRPRAELAPDVRDQTVSELQALFELID